MAARESPIGTGGSSQPLKRKNVNLFSSRRARTRGGGKRSSIRYEMEILSFRTSVGRFEGSSYCYSKELTEFPHREVLKRGGKRREV